jgi:hypothetical protein
LENDDRTDFPLAIESIAAHHFRKASEAALSGYVLINEKEEDRWVPPNFFFLSMTIIGFLDGDIEMACNWTIL